MSERSGERQIRFSQERIMLEVRAILKQRDDAELEVSKLQRELRLHSDCVDQWKEAVCKAEGLLHDLVTGYDQGGAEINPAFIAKVRAHLAPPECEVCVEVRAEVGDPTAQCAQCDVPMELEG
jgi:hypothetical protein